MDRLVASWETKCEGGKVLNTVNGDNNKEEKSPIMTKKAKKSKSKSPNEKCAGESMSERDNRVIIEIDNASKTKRDIVFTPAIESVRKANNSVKNAGKTRQHDDDNNEGGGGSDNDFRIRSSRILNEEVERDIRKRNLKNYTMIRAANRSSI